MTMTATKINPDSAVLQQLDGHWQKMAMLLLWKLAGREKVKITVEEMARWQAEFSPGIPVLLTHGHSDSIEFQVIDEAAAMRIADHEKTMKGTA